MQNKKRALSAYIKLMRAAEAITGRIHRHLANHKLSVSQFGVLEAIFHLGPLCQRDLARKLLKSGGNITMVITNLERRKLIRRRRDEADRRYYLVELTKDGKDLVETVFPDYASRVVKEFSILDAAEQEELQRLCLKLGQQPQA
ncbi:MAG: MarR family transcriptional regulator [Desulfuromonas sp.]|nr:MAG: MarR family transcriptional regulator [Desulfuromonas sp.]